LSSYMVANVGNKKRSGLEPKAYQPLRTCKK